MQMDPFHPPFEINSAWPSTPMVQLPREPRPVHLTHEEVTGSHGDTGLPF